MSASTRIRLGGRTAAVVACSLLGLASLAGCGGDGDSGASGKPVTLTFWGWARGTQQVVDAFNASHQDIKVKFEQIPSGNAGGYAKISNAVKAGNEPDVYNVEYQQVPTFVSQGAAQDITALAGDAKAKYLPQAMDLVTLENKIWALPLDAAPQAFFYRKDIFARDKITPPKTWDEFRTAAQKVKATDPKARIGTFFSDDPSFLEAMSWQAGAKWFGTAGDAWTINLMDPATTKVSAYWQGLVKDDLVRVQPGFSPEWTSSLQTGGTIGYLGAAWGAGSLKAPLAKLSGKWAVAPIPTWDGQPASGMLGGSTFLVGKHSKHAKEAVEFSTWATTTEPGMLARINAGTSSVFPADPDLVPVAKKAFDTAFYGGQDIYSVFVDASTSVRPGWVWGPSMGVTNTSMKDTLGKLTAGSTIDQALRAGQAATLADLKNRGVRVNP